MNRKNLTAIENVDGKTLSEFLISEHPQTIAIVVAHLDVAKQLEVIRNFPEGIRPEVIMRMAALEYVSPEKVEELDTILKKELAGRTGKEKKQFGGVSAVAELINSLDKKTMNSLMTRLEDKDPLLSEEIKASMFSFADIAKIDDRGIQLILREVPQDKLLLALKSATDELREKVFGAMSERAAQMMRDDLSALGPQKVSDVEKAQREIIKVVKRLEEEGKIIVGMGEGGDVVN